MKKIILILTITLFLTGCNSYIELNDLAIINKIGIEHSNTYKLYVSIIDNSLKQTDKTITIEGNNIQELINKLSTSLNKKIYLSHLDLLIINDSIKAFELKELINFFLNNNETRNDFLVVNTSNIKEILEKSKFQEINNLIEINRKNTSKSINTTMYDIIVNYYLNKPIYLSNIILEDTIKLNGLTKIHNNKIEHINNDDVIYINYLLNNIDTYKQNIECDYNKYIYLNILSSNTNIINNKLLITNEIKIINNDCNLNKEKINKLFNDNLKDNLKKYTNKKIDIKNTIRSFYENN